MQSVRYKKVLDFTVSATKVVLNKGLIYDFITGFLKVQSSLERSKPG